MPSDRESLLAAIRAHPDEDTPRLMVADWLDENGDPERAEFIRVQCEAARLADDGSDSQALYEFLVDRDYVTRIDDREAELLAKWKAASALRVLHLRYNEMTDAAARALLDSPNLANLDDLGVSGATDETAARLKARFKHFGAGYP